MTSNYFEGQQHLYHSDERFGFYPGIGFGRPRFGYGFGRRPFGFGYGFGFPFLTGLAAGALLAPRPYYYPYPPYPYAPYYYW